MHKNNKQRGFTLIELMITVAVVAILATIAMPSYQNAIRKAKRTDAKSALTDVAQKLELLFARNTSYSVDMTTIGFTNAGWNSVPVGALAGDQHYRVRILPPPNNGNCPVTNCYRLRAQPLAGTDQANDAVTDYRLWSDGRKRSRRDGIWNWTWSN